MTAQLLTEHHLEFLSLKGSCTGLSESTLVKMSNCWKSHAEAHFILHKLVTMATGDMGSNKDTAKCFGNQNKTSLIFASLQPSQQFFSHVGTGLPGFNQFFFFV